MHVDLPRALLAAAIVFVINLPLGWMRGGARPLLKVHLPFRRDWSRALGVTLLSLALSLSVAWLACRAGRLRPLFFVPPGVLVGLFAQALAERRRYRSGPLPPVMRG